MSTSNFLTMTVRIAAILMLTLGMAQPVYAAPDNDNFANAILLDGSLPVGVYIDNTGATFEADEPYLDCLGEYPAKTVWYSYIPSEDTRISAFADGGLVAVYKGNSLTTIEKVGYQSGCDLNTFQAQVGTTYYFQLSSWYESEGSIGLWLDFTPDPQVDIEVSPEYPNLVDEMVSFQAYVEDPAGVYQESYVWSLWDGTTRTSIYGDLQLYRPFTEDGDYPLSVTVTTLDGRTATASTVVEVRTRDIGITKINTSQIARAYQTKEIAVELTNRSPYPCDVMLVLNKGVPGGSEFVDVFSIQVPAGAKRPTLVKFEYTFTSADAAIGKVTFAVEANIIYGRDALPADNVAYRTVIVR